MRIVKPYKELLKAIWEAPKVRTAFVALITAIAAVVADKLGAF